MIGMANIFQYWKKSLTEMANKYSALLERWKFVELYFKDKLKRKILGYVRNLHLVFKKREVLNI